MKCFYYSFDRIQQFDQRTHTQHKLDMTQFIPPKRLRNPHVQTLLPRFLRRKTVFDPFWQTLETPDGDFLDLAWSENWQTVDKNKRICVFFHGLEGGFSSPYANGVMHSFANRGWVSVLMHFRGCSGRPNRLARAYHSGEIEDARFVLEYLAREFPDRTKIAVGFSLGGNMLARYLAINNDEPLLDGATIVSAPFDLAGCAERLEEGFSKIYSSYLLSSLKKGALKKYRLLNQAIGVEGKDIKKIGSLKAFDDVITAPLHGFKDATDYYKQCSALPILPDISIPTQIVHAKDDPFMSRSVVPDFPLPAHINYRLLTNGGHVGFVNGTFWKPTFWLEEYLPNYYEKTF